MCVCVEILAKKLLGTLTETGFLWWTSLPPHTILSGSTTDEETEQTGNPNEELFSVLNKLKCTIIHV